MKIGIKISNKLGSIKIQTHKIILANKTQIILSF